MSSPSTRTDLTNDLDRADRLKRELCEFATSGGLKKEYEQQQKLFFESAAPADDAEEESLLDWFLFDWFGETGQGVIDHFLAASSNLTERDRSILNDWKDSISSVFEIHSLGKTTLTLRELDTKDKFPITTVQALDQTPFQRGQCIGARLLPLGDRFIFSGLQCIMPDRESARDALEMRRRLEAISSPEALEKAQEEQCSAFCEFFGCDELTVTPGELVSTLGRFQRYLFEEWRNPETGTTPIEEFKSQFGRELRIPEVPPPPPDVFTSGEVTILCDEFDGLVLLPDYSRFKLVFDGRGSRPEGWEDLVWNYIKDPDIPIVAFERVAERSPAQVEKVFRELLEDRTFSINHLYAVLLHYKQPVEGIEDLKDDERLWDFFDGKTEKASRRAPARTKARPKPTQTSKLATKSRTSAKVGPKHKQKATKSRAASKATAAKKGKVGTASKRTAGSATKGSASSRRGAKARKSATARKR